MRSEHPQYEHTTHISARCKKKLSISGNLSDGQSDRQSDAMPGNGSDRRTAGVFGVSRMIRPSSILFCALLGIMVLISGTADAEESSKTHTAARLFSKSKTFISDEDSVEHGVVLLDFFNDACGPCRAMMPAVDSLVQRGFRVSKVNTDRFPDWAQRFNITKIPCFVVIVDGKEVARHVGVTSEQKLENLIVQAGGTPSFRPKRLNSSSRQYVQAAPSAWRGREANVSIQDILAGNCTFTTGLKQTPSAQLAAASANDTVPANRAIASNAQNAFQKVSSNSQNASESLQWRSADPGANPAGNSSSNAAPSGNSPAAGTDILAFSEPQSTADLILASTVRINVLGSTQGSGTGTLIDCRSGYALVLTCGHLFREYVKEGGTISVDLFTAGGKRTLEGKYIHHNEEADLGILSVAVDFPVQTVRVAQNDFPLRKGLPISTCGCSHGADPTLQTGNITNLNRYLGPENIEVSAVPVAGRSGGGMFSENGELLGVCVAADVEDQEGMFTSLTEIHSYFRHLKMERFVHSPLNESRQRIDAPRQTIALEDLPPANTDHRPEIPVSVMPTSRVTAIPQNGVSGEHSIVMPNSPARIQDPFAQPLKPAEPTAAPAQYAAESQNVQNAQNAQGAQAPGTPNVPVTQIPEGTLTGEAAPEWPPRW